MVRGYVEQAQPTHVTGWALDQANPDQRVRLAIRDGDTLIAEVIADRYREDLANAHGTDGRHGFYIAFPKGLFPLPVHALTVTAIDYDKPIGGSPVLIRRGEGSGQVDADGEWLDGRIASLTRAARTASELEPVIALLANNFSAALARREELLNRQFSPNSEAGYSEKDIEDLPSFLKDSLERLRILHKPMWVPAVKTPALSIALAARSGVSDIAESLTSLLKNRPGVPFETLLIDGSGRPEMVLAPFLFGGGLRYFRAGPEMSNTQLWAIAARLARSDMLLFMDDTVRLHAGTITALLTSPDVSTGRAVVGPRLFSEDGRQLEAGALLGPMGQRQPLGYGASVNDPTSARLAPTDDLAPSMMMMARRAYRAIGGFSEARNLGALGVPDVAMRLRRKGIQVLTQGQAQVTIIGERLGANTVPDAARRAFAEHYAKELGVLEQERKKLRPRALVIDSIWPDPFRDAASEVIISHGRLIEQLGYAVEFSAFEALDAGEGCERPALGAGLAAYGPTHFASPLEHIEARKEDLALVYVHRVAAAERVIPVIRRVAPQARIVFNIADLHFLRRFRESELTEASNMLAEIDALRQRELNAMAAADVVITHSHEEAFVIRQLLPNVVAQVVGWPFEPRPAPPSFAARKGIAFVGGYRHRPNVDAVQHFVAEIFPKLRERLPDLELSLIGSHMPESVTRLSGPGIRILGFQRDLGKALDSVRLSIAPLRFGAGVKGKVLTSLAAGVPCVMSPIAAEGLDLPSELAGTIVEAPEAWVEAIATLYGDEAGWQSCAEAGRRFIVAQFSGDSVRNQLHAALQATQQPAPAEAEPGESAAPASPDPVPEGSGTDHPAEPNPEPTS